METALAIIHVSLLSSFLLSFFAPSSHQLLPHLLFAFHCSCTTLINFLLPHPLCIRSSPLAFLCRLFICPISSSSPSLSDHTECGSGASAKPLLTAPL